MAGRKPKPTHLHLVEGTLNVTRHKGRKSEPQPQGNLREAPEWMDAAQREAWDYAVAHAPHGLLKKLDASTLAAWVVANVLHRQVSERLAQMGVDQFYYETDKGSMGTHPLVGVVSRQALIMIKAASELGFTPTARAKVSIEADGQPEDPAEAFFG